MTLRYPGFISYRHDNFPLMSEFVDQFCLALDSELSPRLANGVFRDRDRLHGGDFFTPVLADALCHSACMIAIIVPSYFDNQHTFCAREYRAMELIEAERREVMRAKGLPISNHGDIIPVVARGFQRLPSPIKDQRHVYDFSDFFLGETPMVSNPNYNRQIGQIADYITERFHNLCEAEDICGECSKFSLPDANDIAPWLPNMMLKPLLFPGRSGV